MAFCKVDIDNIHTIFSEELFPADRFNSPKELLDSLFGKLEPYMDLDFYIYYALDEQASPKLHPVCWGGAITPFETELLKCYIPGTPVSLPSLQKEQVFDADDIQASTEPYLEVLRDVGLQSFVSLALLVQQLPGILAIGSRRKSSYAPYEKEFLHTICNVITPTLKRFCLKPSVPPAENRSAPEKEKYAFYSSVALSEPLFADNPDPMVITSLRDGQVIAANQAFTRFTGFGLGDILTNESHLVHMNALWDYILNNSPFSPDSVEVTFTNANSEQKTGFLHSFFLDLIDIPCRVTIIHDTYIHERYAEELIKLSKYHTVGEIAAGIGHEVRNPMTTVRGFLQLMEAQEQNPRQSSYLRLMIEELDRANAIISEFLSLARNDSPELEAGDLNQLIEKLLPLLEADAIVAGKTVTANLSEIGAINLDRSQLRQLILNLVRNGLEAVAEGGSVTIHTFPEGSEAVLIIEDNGKGIPQDKLKHIWDPFFTTKKNGSGLGLPICYRIAAGHGAVMDVKTGSGGTSFYIKFPLLPTD
nr:ATP-binding protein [Paenibacillus caui]